MLAMVLEAARQPLQARDVPVPQLARMAERASEDAHSATAGHVLIKVNACGVCRTDLHIVDGELAQPRLPLILGHEIAGTVVQTGEGVERFHVGDRVGVPWVGYTCGDCPYCRQGRENLCDNARFTGYTLDGGYAEYTVADQRYCFALPAAYSDAEAAPLLCAGLIGYRSYRMIGAGVQRLGIYGFGAAAHIIAQIAIHQGKRVYAFTRPGDTATQAFARQLGAVWAGGSDERPPEALDAAILFAPVGSLVPAALRAVDKGGTVVCGGIHMSDIPQFPYALLWEERSVRSVANLTRQDGEEFMALAAQFRINVRATPFPLRQANEALDSLRHGKIDGAAVLIPSGF